ncbi:ABC transporter [Erysipelotrichaceae bacterium MTC7]|nr:ABC transporter [Erysipelotrichaceae bacterium MTC7]
MNKKTSALKVSLVSVGLGLLLGLLILIVSGYSPMVLFNAILRGLTGMTTMRPVFNLRNTGEFIVFSLPLILTGLSVAFAYKTGMFNIGAEGQFMVGACASVVVAILVPLPGILHVVAAVLAGALAGALWGFIPGLLKSNFKINEVVVCIMLNYFGMYLSNFILKSLPGSSISKTVVIPTSASLSSDVLSSITNNSRLHWGILIVALCVFGYWFILNKTSFGFSLRATGHNEHAADYAGMKTKRNIILSMMIAGALAGLAGAIMSLGVFNMGRVLSGFENYGFDGIAVAFVGAFNAIGIVLAGLLFGLLKVMAPLMQATGVPKEINEIISAFIVLFVAMQYGIRLLLNKLALRKHNKGKPNTLETSKEGK